MHRNLHRALARRAKLLAGVGAAIACTTPAMAQSTPEKAATYVTPYLEVDQVLTAPLSGGGDVLTYTDVAVGVDAGIHTRRVEAQIGAPGTVIVDTKDKFLYFVLPNKKAIRYGVAVGAEASRSACLAPVERLLHQLLEGRGGTVKVASLSRRESVAMPASGLPELH